MEWEPVIGLEVHTQLSTQSKIFSGAATLYGAEPNRQACAIDLGFPGVLPVLNKAVVDMAIKFGLAIEATIPRYSIFARKNYFYPDLPKGYQISQFELPIVCDGYIDIKLEEQPTKTIRIRRAHLEEDAGKSLHNAYQGMSGIDLNRAGTPLLEIVTEPDMRSAKEAVAYLKILHTLVRYLEICDGNMQEGSFRCDANVSIRPRGSIQLGTRTELKNINSFRFVERAINYEIERQIMVLENGGEIVQETRLYDADKNETRPMRSKEEATDYRYFPDPDLLPVVITETMIDEIRDQLPELPQAKIQRFIEQYELNPEDAENLVDDLITAAFFEATVKASQASPKMIANWLTGEFNAYLNQAGIGMKDCPIAPEQLAKLLDRIVDQTISSKIAKDVFAAMWQDEAGGDPDAIIKQKGLQQMTDVGALEQIVAEIIANNPEQVQQYLAGKEKVLGYLVGQIMKQTQGKANPAQVNKLLREQIEKIR